MPEENKSKAKKEEKEIVRVSVSEAGRLFGVTAQTVRRAIAAGEITYIIVNDRYKINFESLVRWSQRRTAIRNKLAKQGIGQYVAKWKIKNPLYSPNPKSVKKTPADDAKQAEQKEETNNPSE